MTTSENTDTTSPGARRMRRYRERRRRGVSCVIIQLFETEISALIQRGLLEPTQRHDKAAIARAMGLFLDRNPIARWR
jgi:hypothetical protein